METMACPSKKIKMRSFVRQIYTIVILALLCDIVASISSEKYERTTNSLRRGGVSERLLKGSKSKGKGKGKGKGEKSKGKGKEKGKGEKSKGKAKGKGEKSKGKGKGKGSKGSKTSGRRHYSSTSYSSDDPRGRYDEPIQKGYSDDDRYPDDDHDDVVEDARAIIPDRRPNSGEDVAISDGSGVGVDFAFGTTERERSEDDAEFVNDEVAQSGVVDIVQDDKHQDFNSTKTEPNESSDTDIIEDNEPMDNSTDTESAESNDNEIFQDDASEDSDSADESEQFNEFFDIVAVKDDEPKEGDSVNEIIENPNNEATQEGFFNFVDLEDDGSDDVDSISGKISIPTPKFTESPTESFPEQTLAPTAIITEVGSEEPVSKFEDDTRTVQIMHPGVENKCMMFDYLRDDTAIYMAPCSTRKTRKDDYWEVLRVKDERYKFQLRHKSTKLCIPMNPNNPTNPFDCVQYFGRNEAIADSFRGLTNCDSGYAAVFEVEGGSNFLYMSNSGCQDPSFVDPIPIFMTYDKPELTGANPIVVWGGHILMGLRQQAAEFNFNAEWKFVEVQEM